MNVMQFKNTGRNTGRARGLPAVLLMLGMAGCASTPIETGDSVTLEPSTPAEVVAAVAPISGTVLWGGVLIGASNLADSTQLEVLAYPLDRTQRPMRDRPALGRFLVENEGYLETVDYAEGREITVLGALDGLVEGQVGEARQQWPRVRAEQLHLWREGGPGEQPRFTFGIGIGIGN